MGYKLWLSGGFVLTCIVLSLQVGCISGNDGDRSGTIVLGAVLPLTGPAAQIGVWQQRGIQLAVDRLNAGGGIREKPVAVMFDDSAGDPKTGLSAFRRLLAVSEPTAIFSSLSSVSNALLPLADEHELVTMLLSVSYPDITQDHPWAVRCHLGSEDEAIAMVAYLTTTDIRRLAIAYINDDFGIGASRALATLAGEATLSIVHSEPYEATATDLRTVATKLMSGNPEAIYVVGYVRSSVLLVKQLRELGYSGRILANMAMSVPSLLQLGGEALDDAIFTVTNFDPKSARPDVREFVDAYRAMSKEDPTFFSGFAYDATLILGQTLREVGSDADRLRGALMKVRDYSGVMGTLSIGEDREIRFPTKVVRYQDGSIVGVGQP